MVEANGPDQLAAKFEQPVYLACSCCGKLIEDSTDQNACFGIKPYPHDQGVGECFENRRQVRREVFPFRKPIAIFTSSTMAKGSRSKTSITQRFVWSHDFLRYRMWASANSASGSMEWVFICVWREAAELVTIFRHLQSIND